MIIDGKTVSICQFSPQKDNNEYELSFADKCINVRLGNLGLHNACSYYVNKDPKQYPIAWFVDKGGAHYCLPDKPGNCAADETIDKQFDTPLESLLWYAKGLQEEHEDLSDEQINHSASFTGRKRSARWEDERCRRGLQN